MNSSCAIEIAAKKNIVVIFLLLLVEEWKVVVVAYRFPFEMWMPLYLLTAVILLCIFSQRFWVFLLVPNKSLFPIRMCKYRVQNNFYFENKQLRNKCLTLASMFCFFSFFSFTVTLRMRFSPFLRSRWFTKQDMKKDSHWTKDSVFTRLMICSVIWYLRNMTFSAMTWPHMHDLTLKATYEIKTFLLV